MALDKRTREQMLALCGEIHADDGIDPRTYFRPQRTPNKENYKAKQLCRQVAETLDQVLSGETGDDLLRNLRLVSVAPAPDSSRIRVTLQIDLAVETCSLAEVQRRLTGYEARLRCEVAAAITRRKAPVLTFEVVCGDAPPSAATEEETP